jgi:uncharacterized protein YdcH (DUF465 family)
MGVSSESYGAMFRSVKKLKSRDAIFLSIFNLHNKLKSCILSGNHEQFIKQIISDYSNEREKVTQDFESKKIEKFVYNTKSHN